MRRLRARARAPRVAVGALGPPVAPHTLRRASGPRRATHLRKLRKAVAPSRSYPANARAKAAPPSRTPEYSKVVSDLREWRRLNARRDIHPVENSGNAPTVAAACQPFAGRPAEPSADLLNFRKGKCAGADAGAGRQGCAGKVGSVIGMRLLATFTCRSSRLSSA